MTGIKTTSSKDFRSLLALPVAGALVGGLVVPATAEDGRDVTIVNPITVDESAEATVTGGPFSATGSAVEDGLLCDVGTMRELYAHGVPLPGDDFRVLVLKQLTCDDQPGELAVALWVDVVEGVGNDFEWQTLWGTGSLAGICGAGEGEGVWGQDPAVIDTYSGWLASDDRCERAG